MNTNCLGITPKICRSCQPPPGKPAREKGTPRQRYDNFQGGVTDEALQPLISRLREKIEPDRSPPQYLVTVRGEGYKFVLSGEYK